VTRGARQFARTTMNKIQRSLGLFALVLGIAAGCSGDDDASSDPPPETGAAGDAGAGGAPGDAGAGAGAGGATAGGATAGGAGAATGPGGTSVGRGAAGDGGDGGDGGAIIGDSAGAGGVTAEAGAGGAAGTPGEAGTAGAAGASTDPLASSTVLDVNDVKTNPEPYAWFDFKPNVKKLILAGAAETEHIAILWYTVADGGVGLHYHSKTESVYVIDGTQTDAKGVYTDGTVYFNPPGSGHQISDSSGFFLLAYAAPPDFANTDLIEPYTPVRIDTTDPDLTTTYDFSEEAAGVQTYVVPLVETGGLSSKLIETTSTTPMSYEGNYLLVLEGSCDIEGVTLGQGKLVVAKALAPQSYAVSASADSTCLAMGVSF
jgi:hypothetical protein